MQHISRAGLTAGLGNDREKMMEAAVAEQKSSIWTDPRTGLSWQCESPGEMSWNEAMNYARTLSLAGGTDWRLPTARELETLLDRSRYRPVMFEDIPFRDTLSYWSATTFGHHTNNAWIVMFEGAYVLSYYKSNRYHVRCVRGDDGANELQAQRQEGPDDE